MRYILMLWCGLFAWPVAAQDFVLREAPMDRQFLPRNLKTNKGLAFYSGELRGDYDSLVVCGMVNGVRVISLDLPLKKNRKDPGFVFALDLNADLVQYDLELLAYKGGRSERLHKADSIVVGDAVILHGQSNSLAIEYKGTAQPLASPFIRSFGNSHPDPTKGNNAWHVARCDEIWTSGAIGQWGMRFARYMIDSLRIPIAILNGAHGGKPIPFFQRNDANHFDLATNYGRLLSRARNAGLQDHIRAMYYYQGESDEQDAEGHRRGFHALYQDIVEDYPGLQHMIVFQVRAGCGKPSIQLRDYQRTFQDSLPLVTSITNNAVRAYDGCHYDYEDGYATIARNAFRLSRYLMYDGSKRDHVFSLNVGALYFESPDRIVLETRCPRDSIIIEAGAEQDFVFQDAGLRVMSLETRGNRLWLNLNKAITPGTTCRLSYLGHTTERDRWIYNPGGLGLFSFHALPVAPNAAAVVAPATSWKDCVFLP